MTRATTANEFVIQYAKGTLGRQTTQGKWEVEEIDNIQILQYRWLKDKYNDEYDIEHVAYKYPNGSILCNSNELQHAGVTYAWGNKKGSWGDARTKEQKLLESLGATMFPFTLFTEAALSPSTFKWIVEPVSETVTLLVKKTNYQAKPDEATHRIVEEPRHFAGRSIFKIADGCYLFDVDRQELTHGIFNAFLTKLPRDALTFEDAYAMLMPTEVKVAIEQGVDVQRQGEFFFIYNSDDMPKGVRELTPEEQQVIRYKPSKEGFGISSMRWSGDSEPYGNEHELLTDAHREFEKAALKYRDVKAIFDNINPKEGSLGKSTTGSHTVKKYILIGDVAYVSGKVSQSRREHADLELTGWYKVCANTAITSWTITGKID